MVLRLYQFKPFTKTGIEIHNFAEIPVIRNLDYRWENVIKSKNICLNIQTVIETLIVSVLKSRLVLRLSKL